MEMNRKEVLNVSLSKSAESSVYCNNYSRNLDLDFVDFDTAGIRHEIELKMPLELAKPRLPRLLFLRLPTKKVSRLGVDAPLRLW